MLHLNSLAVRETTAFVPNPEFPGVGLLVGSWQFRCCHSECSEADGRRYRLGLRRESPWPLLERIPGSLDLKRYRLPRVPGDLPTGSCAGRCRSTPHGA